MPVESPAGETPSEPRLGPRIAAGQTAEVYALADDPDRVVKRFLDAAAPAEREAVATRVAGATGVPAPTVFGTVTVDGHPGIVLERVEGPTMLAALRGRPWRLPALAVRLAELHASVHGCRGPGLPSTTDRLARRIQRADLPRSVEGRVLEHLSGLPGGDRLCHGDFHPDNVVLTGGGPRIIDWADATAGPPAADVARTVLLVCLATASGGALSRAGVAAMRTTLHRVYRRRYCRIAGVDSRSVRRWLLPVAAARLQEGIADERRRLRAYLDRAVRHPDAPGLP